MQQRNIASPALSLVRLIGLRLSFLLFLSLCLTNITAIVHGQVRIPETALESGLDIQHILDAGLQYEQERQWSDALSHYEDALRTHPGRREIQQRLTVSRIHFDLSRRYADSTYVTALASMREREALDLYSELLLKIDTHYVAPPNWHALVHRGTDNLSIALTDRGFVERHLPNVSTERISAFQRELRRQMDWQKPRTRQEARAAVSSAGRLAVQRLRLPEAVAVMEYCCGAAAALDDYSAYLTPSQLDDVYSQIEGNFVGLGVELTAKDGNLLIVNVLESSPAQQGGILAGDRIVEVDGRSTINISTDQAADMLKGEEGSLVDLGVLSADERSYHLRLRRQRVDVPSVENVKMLDSQVGIAYLRLSSFQKTTSRDIDAALWKLHRQGLRSLVIDVRNNPGGLLTAAVEVADKFVQRGTIVSTRGRSPREDFDYKAHHGGTWPVPLVILIDGDSASASEIFAAAVHDLGRGTIVGQTTYGKGSVQAIFPLNYSNSGIRITTAKFYTPKGQPISKRGISPDIIVHVTARSAGEPTKNSGFDSPDDPVLAAGLQAARQLLASKRR